ncbi:MAG: pantoate--beta-alanine ligase [Pseudomonadota bacterium]
MIESFSTSEQMNAQAQTWKNNQLTIALVPTMGNLHAGHLSLISQAKAMADQVIVSIYVNALQFNQDQDFNSYPRTLAEDIKQLEALEIDALFAPSEDDLYPNGIDLAPRIYMPGLADEFCGKYRPGHFEGVCTVVTKLFNVTTPDIAIFGKKDYQQLLIIKRLTEELKLAIDIQEGETVREQDGLAMSSRNNHLTAEQRSRAARLYTTLCWAAEEYQYDRIREIEAQARNNLEKHGFRIDYLNFSDADNLQPITQTTNKYVVLAAAWLDKTRLIDNIVFQ